MSKARCPGQSSLRHTRTWFARLMHKIQPSVNRPAKGTAARFSPSILDVLMSLHDHSLPPKNCRPRILKTIMKSRHSSPSVASGGRAFPRVSITPCGGPPIYCGAKQDGHKQDRSPTHTLNPEKRRTTRSGNMHRNSLVTLNSCKVVHPGIRETRPAYRDATMGAVSVRTVMMPSSSTDHCYARR